MADEPLDGVAQKCHVEHVLAEKVSEKRIKGFEINFLDIFLPRIKCFEINLDTFFSFFPGNCAPPLINSLEVLQMPAPV